MCFMKPATLLVTCILLFTGNLASASMPCLMYMHQVSSQTHMDSEMHMPCLHSEAENSKNQNSDQCEDCDCLRTVFLPSEESTNYHERTTIKKFAVSLPLSIRIDPPFHPPKYIF